MKREKLATEIEDLNDKEDLLKQESKTNKSMINLPNDDDRKKLQVQ